MSQPIVTDTTLRLQTMSNHFHVLRAREFSFHSPVVSMYAIREKDKMITRYTRFSFHKFWDFLFSRLLIKCRFVFLVQMFNSGFIVPQRSASTLVVHYVKWVAFTYSCKCTRQVFVQRVLESSYLLPLSFFFLPPPPFCVFKSTSCSQGLGSSYVTVDNFFNYDTVDNFFSFFFFFPSSSSLLPPQWGSADAEIKVPSGENTELKRSPFKAWSGSVYRHTCHTYCQGFLPCLFLPFRSVHLHFFQNFSRFFLCWLWLTHDSCIGPQNKIGHPAECRFPCWVPAECRKAIKKIN